MLYNIAMTNLWPLYALLSAFFGALIPIFAKAGLKNVDTNTATAIRAIVMAIFLFGLIIFQGKFSQVQTTLQNHKALLLIILSGLAGAFSWLFYFLALKSGTVCQVTPLDRLSLVFAVVFALVFLGESINSVVAIGLTLIIIGTTIALIGQ